MEDVYHSLLDSTIAESSALISEEDVQETDAKLDDGSFAALMLFENTWATAFRDAVLNAKGEMPLSDRIPHGVIAFPMVSLKRLWLSKVGKTTRIER